MLRYSVTKPLRAISGNKNYVANKERNPYGQKEKSADGRRSRTDINALAVRKGDRRRLLDVLDGYVVSRGPVRPESNIERDVIINPDARNVHQWKDKEPSQEDENNDAPPPDMLFSIHSVPTVMIAEPCRRSLPNTSKTRNGGDASTAPAP
jgi:hypothetical protein